MALHVDFRLVRASMLYHTLFPSINELKVEETWKGFFVQAKVYKDQYVFGAMQQQKRERFCFCYKV